jgi:hypothetical protein
MRLLMSVTSVVFLAVTVNGCSDSISPESIVGIWVEDGSPPGNSLEIMLALNASAISGRGSWCGEALGCGLTTVIGTATGNGFHLVTTFDNGRIETFDGSLVSSSSLAGTETETFSDGTHVSRDQFFTRVIRDPAS